MTVPYLLGPVELTIASCCSAGAIVIPIWQICQHLRNYTEPSFQRYIIRIIFLVPFYAASSWLALRFREDSMYFITPRDCYEAWVIYNFMALCMAYVGGPGAVVVQAEGKMIQPSWILCTCCLPPMPVNGFFLRRCKQGTLQFVILKPILAIITLVLFMTGNYAVSSWSPKEGYLYIAVTYNFCYSLALFWMLLFYVGTEELLQPYKPLMKFICFKSVIFLTFWQGLAIGFLSTRFKFTASDSEALQNWIVCVEMFVVSVAMLWAFPHSEYKIGGQATGWSWEAVLHALSCMDAITDIFYQFNPTYKSYVLHSDGGPAEHIKFKSFLGGKKRALGDKLPQFSLPHLHWGPGGGGSRVVKKKKQRGGGSQIDDREAANGDEEGHLWYGGGEQGVNILDRIINTGGATAKTVSTNVISWIPKITERDRNQAELLASDSDAEYDEENIRDNRIRAHNDDSDDDSDDDHYRGANKRLPSDPSPQKQWPDNYGSRGQSTNGNSLAASAMQAAAAAKPATPATMSITPVFGIPIPRVSNSGDTERHSSVHSSLPALPLPPPPKPADWIARAAAIQQSRRSSGGAHEQAAPGSRRASADPGTGQAAAAAAAVAPAGAADAGSDGDEWTEMQSAGDAVPASATASSASSAPDAHGSQNKGSETDRSPAQGQGTVATGPGNSEGEPVDSVSGANYAADGTNATAHIEPADGKKAQSVQQGDGAACEEVEEPAGAQPEPQPAEAESEAHSAAHSAKAQSAEAESAEAQPAEAQSEVQPEVPTQAEPQQQPEAQQGWQSNVQMPRHDSTAADDVPLLNDSSPAQAAPADDVTAQPEPDEQFDSLAVPASGGSRPSITGSALPKQDPTRPGLAHIDEYDTDNRQFEGSASGAECSPGAEDHHHAAKSPSTAGDTHVCAESQLGSDDEDEWCEMQSATTMPDSQPVLQAVAAEHTPATDASAAHTHS